jgi:hypothetical protein
MGSDHAIGGHHTFKSAGTLLFASLNSIRKFVRLRANAHADEAIP